jgi:hypothetical protein
MPTSQPRTLTPIHSVMQALSPHSLIDLGVGHGKTGVLAREYLDIMKCRYKPETWETQIYGIEVFPDYHNPLWDYAYDLVVTSEALEGLRSLPEVDLVVASDVWEHFEPEYAHAVLGLCLQKATYLLISTPKAPLRQDAVLGNVAERHVSRWSPRDFREVPHLWVSATTHDWILLLSSRARIPNSVRRLSSPRALLYESLRTAAELWLLRSWNR